MTEYELAGIETIARGVAISNGRLLLCRAKGSKTSYLPGGHIEFGETGREALIREMKEETGLAVTTGRFLGVVENSFLQHDKPHAEINLVYAMTLDTTTGSVPTTSSGSVPTTASGSVPTTDSGSVPTTDSGSVPTTDSGSVPITGSGAVPTTSSGSVPTTGSGSVPTTASGSVPTIVSCEDWISFEWCPLTELAAAGLLPEAFRQLGTDPHSTFSP